MNPLNDLLSYSDGSKLFRHKQPAVRPKHWQKNSRKLKTSKQGGNGKIGKSKNSSKTSFNSSLLSNIPEHTILENFGDQRIFSSEKLLDRSIDFKNNGILQADEIPFSPTIDQSEFSHTFPKPIGWGRKIDLGRTLTLDSRYSGCKDVRSLESCLGILHTKMEPIKRPECAFCRRNNAKDFYHPLKDELGGVVCPVLSAFTCKMCAATGRNAHTHKYCPVNPITKGDPIAAGMPPGRPLTKADKEWLKYFQTKYFLQFLDGSRSIGR